MIPFRWNNRGKWLGDKNNLILLAVDGQHRLSAENYPDLPAAHGRAQTAPPSSAGWQTEWADRMSGGWPPSAAPAASRISRGLSSCPAWADTSAPTTEREDHNAGDKTACLTFAMARFCGVPDGKSEPGWCSPSCWWEICSGGRAEAAAGGRCCRRSTRDWSRTSSLNSWECPAGRCARRRTGRSVCKAQFLLKQAERLVRPHIKGVFIPFWLNWIFLTWNLELTPTREPNRPDRLQRRLASRKQSPGLRWHWAAPQTPHTETQMPHPPQSRPVKQKFYTREHCRECATCARPQVYSTATHGFPELDVIVAGASGKPARNRKISKRTISVCTEARR